MSRPCPHTAFGHVALQTLRLLSCTHYLQTYTCTRGCPMSLRAGTRAQLRSLQRQLLLKSVRLLCHPESHRPCFVLPALRQSKFVPSYPSISKLNGIISAQRSRTFTWVGLSMVRVTFTTCEVLTEALQAKRHPLVRVMLGGSMIFQYSANRTRDYGHAWLFAEVLAAGCCSQFRHWNSSVEQSRGVRECPSVLWSKLAHPCTLNAT
jgi:hypothetical protein